MITFCSQINFILKTYSNPYLTPTEIISLRTVGGLLTPFHGQVYRNGCVDVIAPSSSSVCIIISNAHLSNPCATSNYCLSLHKDRLIYCSQNTIVTEYDSYRIKENLAYTVMLMPGYNVWVNITERQISCLS
jgi:hypothetical protein